MFAQRHREGFSQTPVNQVHSCVLVERLCHIRLGAGLGVKLLLKTTSMANPKEKACHSSLALFTGKCSIVQTDTSMWNMNHVFLVLWPFL